MDCMSCNISNWKNDMRVFPSAYPNTAHQCMSGLSILSMA